MEADQELELEVRNLATSTVGTGDQEGSKREDQVLIEKDGKFELVNVTDMQAHAARMDYQDIERPGGMDDGGLVTDTSQDEQSLSIDKENQNTGLALTQPQRDDSTYCEVPAEGDSHPSPLEPSSPMQITNNTETQTHDAVEQFKSDSHVTIIVEENRAIAYPKRKKPADSTTSTSSLVRNTRHKLLISRTKSAPGFRAINVSNNEEDLQKRERNDVAFRAWLARKDKELAQVRQCESSKARRTEDELKEKQKRNEVAYQHWLECKKQDYLEHRTKETVIRPVTSISKDDETRKRAAFESWLTRKQEEKQKEIDNKQQTRDIEEEAAKKADPTIVAQAYKSWLHRKRVQARDEALKKEQYRRKYFKQSRRLKQSATLRFEGF